MLNKGKIWYNNNDNNIRVSGKGKILNILELQLKNFRNYENQTFIFNKGLNVIYGENAGGKTNLVESIYYAGLGKSPRTSRDKELVKWQEEYAYIKVCVEKKYRKHTIEIYIDSQGKKRILIDRLPATKISALIGVINVVYFSPDEMDIIKESPIERRRFLDISLSQQKKQYFTALVRYNKILAQRNKLLKDNLSADKIKETLPIWDAQLAKTGAYIIKERYVFVDSLRDEVKKCHNTLTSGKEDITISYESKLSDTELKGIEEELLTLLTNSYDKDIYLKYTTVGAHRDDLKITINEIDARKYASQGQKRTTALSLKLAELNLFEKETGEKPILIMDDVLSELDEKRQNMLLESVGGTQTFLTCTEYSQKANKYLIAGGQLIKNSQN